MIIVSRIICELVVVYSVSGTNPPDARRRVIITSECPIDVEITLKRRYVSTGK